MKKILVVPCRRLFGISGPSMCEILNLSNLHFRGRLSLHNMFLIFLRIYWCRNFCDMAEISTISIYFAESHMVVNYTPGLNNSKKSDFIRNIRDFSTFFQFCGRNFCRIAEISVSIYPQKNFEQIILSSSFCIYLGATVSQELRHLHTDNRNYVFYSHFL